MEYMAFTIYPLLPKNWRRHRKQKWGKRVGLRARLQTKNHTDWLFSVSFSQMPILINKMDEMKLKIVFAKIDSCVAIVTKTWLDNNISDAAVELAEHSLLRQIAL